MPTYIVNNLTEEFDCDWCGGPVYAGDMALVGPHGYYCSNGCLKQANAADEADLKLGELKNAIATGCYTHP